MKADITLSLESVKMRSLTIFLFKVWWLASHWMYSSSKNISNEHKNEVNGIETKINISEDTYKTDVGN